MMLKIGCFKKDSKQFAGVVTLMQAVPLRLQIVPVHHKAAPESPDWLVVETHGGDATTQVGIGYTKCHHYRDIPYILVTLDNPVLSRPIVAVLCEGVDGLWYLWWDRVSSGETILEILFFQEELKPQIGIRPITNLTHHIQKHFPHLHPS